MKKNLKNLIEEIITEEISEVPENCKTCEYNFKFMINLYFCDDTIVECDMCEKVKED